MTAITTEPPRAAHLADPDVSHIPGPRPKPLVGHTLDVLRDSYGLQRRCIETYGDVYKIKLLGRWRVNLAGPDAVEFVMLDREGIFSNAEGWDALRDLFPGGLLLRDHEDHRAHRRIMQTAFKAPAMGRYLRALDAAMGPLMLNWPVGQRFAFFPAVKELTLRNGASVFMGLPLDDPRADRLNRALMAEVAAGLAPIRRPLPFTTMARGQAARVELTETFRAMIPARRESGGDDFFSQMCAARDEDGAAWSDDEIVDHFNFLLMAAHDTTASALTTMVWAMGAYPDWQERLAAEVATLPDGPLDEAAVAGMDLTDRVLREALRLVPPVPFVPRRAMRGFDWAGVAIPAGTMITVSPGMVMMSPALYTAPERFDPDRFSPNRAEDRNHRFAWAPFGGGAHKCIGLHFAILQVKVFTAALLSRYRVRLADGPGVHWQRMPIPKPRGGLPVVLEPREA